jgi:hypothetical protein
VRRDIFLVAMAMLFVIGFLLFLGVLIFLPAPKPEHDCVKSHAWTAVCPTAEHWNAHVGKP